MHERMEGSAHENRKTLLSVETYQIRRQKMRNKGANQGDILSIEVGLSVERGRV